MNTTHHFKSHCSLGIHKFFAGLNLCKSNTSTYSFIEPEKYGSPTLYLKSMLLFCLLLNTIVKAEDFDVQLTPSVYAGGYNISCYGANTGSISLFISGGNAPYMYVWLDGPTIRNRTNLTAGYYRVVVTASNGSSVIREITLKQPELFQAILNPSEYEGGNNISENGGNNGKVDAEIKGGVPPYTYLWSNGANEHVIENVAAGTYSVTVHDATNCNAVCSVTLIEPTIFHLVTISSPVLNNSNYNTASCEKEDGRINLTVAGGTPPYKYKWSNGAFTQNLIKVKEGDFSVMVGDANGAEVTASITLTSSPKIDANLASFSYPNGKNTSCYACSNASITISNLVGVAPFSFIWNSGQTTQNLSNIAAGSYWVTITDAVGCSLVKEINIVAPEREDWTMGGNPNTDPANQYIGTSDNKDFVFRANNTEKMRLLSGGGTKFTGEVKLSSLMGGGMLYIDGNGTVQSARNGNCSNAQPIWYSNSTQPNLIYTCSPNSVSIGSNVQGATLDVTGTTRISSLATGAGNSKKLVQTDANGLLSTVIIPTKETMNYWQLHTNGNDVYRLAGKVGIGNSNPSSSLDITSSNGEAALKVTCSGDPDYAAQFISNSTVPKIISGILKHNNLSNEIFSIKADGKTVFGNPNQPSLLISQSLDANNIYKFGNVGIGTNAPNGDLQVGEFVTRVSMGNFWNGKSPWMTNYIGFNAGREKVPGAIAGESSGIWTLNGAAGLANGAAVIAGSLGGDMRFITIAPDGEAIPSSINKSDDDILENVKMIIRNDGIVGIGTSSTANFDAGDGFRLYVKGGIRTEKIKVDIAGNNGWADYVFDKKYHLMPLNDLEKFYSTNKHLPEMPSTCNILEDGLDLADMMKLQMKKIEELTLYIVQQQKLLDKQQNQMNQLSICLTK